MKTVNSIFDYNNQNEIQEIPSSISYFPEEQKTVIKIAKNVQEVGESSLTTQKVKQENRVLRDRGNYFNNMISPKKCKIISSDTEKTEKDDSLSQQVNPVKEELKDFDDSSLEIEKQKQWFASQSPEQWYPLQQDLTGRIRFKLPTSLRKVKRLIYIFRHREKERFLIGKTSSSLNGRCSRYASLFNEEGSEKRAKQKGRKSFLQDIKNHHEKFDVAILYILKPQELDLDFFETGFICAYGKTYSLYNDNKGGGGGCAHNEEAPAVYAIPKPGTTPFTPEKYYPYRKDSNGNIRPQFSPGFKQTLNRLKANLHATQELPYAIKKMDTDERYIGVSANPLIRPTQHAYAAEYYDPENEKYDPTRKSGRLHPAMAQDPEQFAFGLLPVQSGESLDGEARENYVFLNSIAAVEQYAIEVKQSLVSQNGFNSNRGGGGPIARRATQLTNPTQRKLF